ncbi:S1 RNA-binding domain-containing protein [Sulfurivermis fontis]|uniref:CvfB family protein n=1 Tax=Sulfurivermis fontis TaxID=1972068 RepID=UPI000FD7AEA3|nr:S1-like domain-containing RNA-binding protein [Sulfurivermis fontis]
MAQLGVLNTLTVLRKGNYGVILDGGELGDVLLPLREAPESCAVGDALEVFVYMDSDDTVVATTQRPLAQVGEFALMKVASATRFGAFLDWGLRKNLLVPFAEQSGNMAVGRAYVVHVYRDKRTGRLVGSTRLDKFLDRTPASYTPRQAVDLLVCEHTDIGYKAIINNRHWGVLHDADVFQPLRYGQRLAGYIKKLREDGKIDLVLQPPGYAKVEGIAGELLEKIKAAGGSINVTDKSPPEVIYARFGVSKKVFKQAISALYRERLITIGADGLRLVR